MTVAPRLVPGHQQTGNIDVGLGFTSEVIRTEGFAVHPTFSVSLALPAGVTLDPSNGVVSGTASTALREVFTLTATAGGVSGSASLLLTIDPTLSVLASYVPLTAGTAVDRALFTANGFPGPVTYTVEPALPPGLRITADGSLVGTPTSASDFSTYVVTAVSGRWRESAITHMQVAPTLDPGYRILDAGVGQELVVPEPRPIGFPVAVSYSVAPDLPAGLRLDQRTGRVIGTPRTGQSSTTYTLTASGGGFIATTELAVNIAAIAPAEQEVAGRAGTRLSSKPLNPTWFRGPVTYSVSPAPPAWLTLNASTGVLSGTPTAALARRVYVITATDGAARTDARVAIQVAAVPSPRPSPAPQPTLAPEPTPEPVPTETRVPGDSAPTAPGASPPTASPGASSDPSSTDQASASDPLLWAVGAVRGLLVLIGVAIVGTAIVRGRRGGA